MNPLCDEATLRAFAEGKLSEEDAQKVLELFLEDDNCLAAMDKIWAEQAQLNDTSPPIESNAAAKLEEMILARIRRTDLGGNVVKLGTQGLMKVLLALIQPFVKK